MFIEAMYYLSAVAYVDYYHAGSAELARAVADVCPEADVIFMRNHGVIICGSSMKEAMCALEIVENVCRMNVLANAGKFKLMPVGEETVTDFLEGGYYRPVKKTILSWK